MSVPSVCPKCGGERRAGEDACPRCGLLVARWSTFTPDAHPALEELWRALEARWDDEAAHDRFLDAALKQDCLDLAAARYAARVKSDDDPRAKAGLARAQVLVERLHAAGAAGERPTWRILYGLAVAVAASLVIVALYLIALALRR